MKMTGTSFIRGATALILGAALALPGAANATAQRPAGPTRDDSFLFHGTSGQRHEIVLQGGRYVLNVYAHYNGAPPSSEATCTFIAQLNGVEHPLGKLSTLGGEPRVSAAVPWRYIPTLNLPAGHYILDVSPSTTCNWSVSIGGGSGHPVMLFGATGIYHMLDGSNVQTTIVEATRQSYSFSVTYAAWGAGFKAPTARLSLLRRGRVLYTFKLSPTIGDYGQTAFSTALTFPPNAVVGAFTARFTLTLGGKTVSKSVPYTVQSLAPGRWTVQDSGVTNTLSDIACPSATTCISPGNQATIVATTDGHTWTRRDTPYGAGFLDLFGVACPTARTCYVVSDLYNILRSTDGGRTWSKLTSGYSFSSIRQHLYAIACPTERHCYTVGTGGMIAATTDGGDHWTLQARYGSGQDLSDVACPTETTCIAVGSDGTVARTTDGGATWQRGTSSAAHGAILFSVSCPTASVCYATGQLGAILHTTDGGTTWTRQNNPLNNSDVWVDSVSCTGTRTCHAVSKIGTILLTTDGGRSWRDQHSPTSEQLNVVTCTGTGAGAGTCYAVGNDGLIIKGA